MYEEKFEMIHEIDETIDNLINCGGGNIEGPNTDYYKNEEYKHLFKNYLSILQEQYGRDPKIANIKLFTNYSRYSFKVIVNKGYKEPEPNYDDLNNFYKDKRILKQFKYEFQAK